MKRQLIVAKNKHRYVFWFDDRDMQALIDAAADLAHDDAVDFDWMDAAVACWRAGVLLQKRVTK